MKKLQAAMRDRAAASWREKKLYYKVGSVFKGCAHCGDYEEEETDSGCTKRRYTSGHMVYRSFSPSQLGWTYWCWECGAKDQAAWENAIDVGRDAITGDRDAVRRGRYALRKQVVKMEVKVVAPSRAQEIARLEAEIAKLTAMLKK